MSFKIDYQKCPACGSELQDWGVLKSFKISACVSCGLGKTVNPKLQKYDYHRDSVYLNSSEQFKNIFERRFNIVTSFHSTPGRVLEIGSSTGLMLSLFKKRGWDVLGIEISSESAEYARRQGIPTLTDPIEKISLPLNSLDVVIINHTLEHLEDPKYVLEKINSLLKKGGLLLVDVPNFGSFSAKLSKTHWFALLPNEHLWHFTFPALSSMLENNGFKVLHRSSPSGIWDYGNPSKEIWQAFKGIKKRFVNILFTTLPNAIVSCFNQGSTLTILAQKKR